MCAGVCGCVWLCVYVCVFGVCACLLLLTERICLCLVCDCVVFCCEYVFGVSLFSMCVCVCS